MWECKCDCGNLTPVSRNNLTSGHTLSCGCLQQRMRRHGEYHKIHGQTGTRLHRIWKDMKTRCTNPNAINYDNYGGRGISVCEEWRKDSYAFREWAVANGYCDDLTLDRIDVNGNYCPENCRWVTRKEQNNNRRDNRKLTFNGRTQSIPEWAEELGLSYGGLYDRLRRGLPIEMVLAPRMRG